jgi:hypothetical protein
MALATTVEGQMRRAATGRWCGSTWRWLRDFDGAVASRPAAIT